MRSRERACSPRQWIAGWIIVVCLLTLITACDAPANSPSSAMVTAPTTPTAAPTTATPELTPAPALRPSPDLRVPGNFVLTLPLHFDSARGVMVDDSGATTQIDSGTIEAQIEQELKHMLFVIDASGNVHVYSPGVTPTIAHVSLDGDQGTVLSYTQNVDSEAGTVSITFEGLLSKNTLRVNYEQLYNPSAFINATTTDVVADFTTQIRWVTASEIPAAPRQGSYHLTGSGAIVLSWEAGQHAVAYEVYRQISDHDQEFQPLAMVKTTSYTDSSPEAIQNLHSMKGVTYAIFSVGASGVENPGAIVIAITS
ncbi:hypothetical protein [Thermogemmatispora sp.]|jgi:hypothetical protein|uniref:hypothetical protein n=1 Tax=Thermogemmatispora sp. TaxID=1968838 RepID=UPI0035E415DE